MVFTILSLNLVPENAVTTDWLTWCDTYHRNSIPASPILLIQLILGAVATLINQKSIHI